MTSPDNFGDFSAALRMKEVIAKLVREEVDRQRPPARYGKVQSFNRNAKTALVLFPGDTDPVTVKVAPNLQPGASLDSNADARYANIVRVEGVPGNLWVTEVVSGQMYQDSTTFGAVGFTGANPYGSSSTQQMARFFSPGTSGLPPVGQCWNFGVWANWNTKQDWGLAYVDVVVQQSVSPANIIKKYSIAVRPYDTGNQWRKCVPTFDSGPSNGHNFELEIKVSDTFVGFRVRRTLSGTGGTPGGYDLSVWFYGQEWDFDNSISYNYVDSSTAPNRVHGTDSAEGVGPFLSPQMNLPTLNQVLMTGGGVVKFTSGTLFWTERFMLLGGGKNPLQTSGFHQLPVPDGVAHNVPVYGRDGVTSVVGVSQGIPLQAWEALYYEPPYGGSQTDWDQNRYRIVYYAGSSQFQVPSHWILVAVRNGDPVSACIKLGTGQVLPSKQAPGLGGGWGNYGAGYLNASYYSVDNRIFLEGLIKNTSASASVAGAIPFVLPVGYRPGAHVTYVAWGTVGGSLGTVRVDVESNGNVSIQTAISAGGFVSLDGISFGQEL